MKRGKTTESRDSQTDRQTSLRLLIRAGMSSGVREADSSEELIRCSSTDEAEGSAEEEEEEGEEGRQSSARAHRRETKSGDTSV